MKVTRLTWACGIHEFNIDYWRDRITDGEKEMEQHYMNCLGIEASGHTFQECCEDMITKIRKKYQV